MREFSLGSLQSAAHGSVLRGQAGCVARDSVGTEPGAQGSEVSEMMQVSAVLISLSRLGFHNRVQYCYYYTGGLTRDQLLDSNLSFHEENRSTGP